MKPKVYLTVRINVNVALCLLVAVAIIERFL